MNTKLLSGVLSAFLFTCSGTMVLAQKNGERRVRIEITRNENGNESHVTREFDLNDGQQLADALRELGVMDELNVIGDDENLVLDLRRMRDGGLLNDMSMALRMADPDAVAQPRAYLGVYYGNWNESCDKEARKKDPPVKEGACITAVESGTPAEQAGLKEGDVIVAMDDRVITSGAGLLDAIRAHDPGDNVKLIYYRGKEKRSTTVALAARDNGPDVMSWNWHTDSAAYERAMEAFGRAMQDMALDSEARFGGAFLGVVGEDLPNNGGVHVTSVSDSSAAQRMGLKEGDAITAINGDKIDNFEDLIDHLADAQPGSKATVDVLRDGRAIVLNGELGERTGAFPMYGGPSGAPFMFPMPNIPDMPYPYSEDGMEEDANGAGQRAEHDHLRREMDELRREMDRLRRDLRGDVIREMRVTVEAVELSPEESTALKNKGVSTLDRSLDLTGLRIAPSPTDGAFDIAFQVPERGDLNVDVHDAGGERIYHETITGFKGNYARTLDMSDRAAGTYFVVISQNGKAQARKVVKQ